MAELLDPYWTVFGQAATLAGQAVRIVLEAPWSLGNVGGVGLSGTQPMARIQTASVAADPVGQTLVVGSISYTVVEHQPDGTGVSRLMLERA